LLKNISSNACRAVCGTVFCCAQHASPSKAITATALAILLIARPDLALILTRIRNRL
jgi:hypothetical protein